MDCLQLKSNIFAYCEGALSKEQCQSFEAHVSSCIDCKQLMTELNQMEAVIEMEKSVEPSPFAATRILQHLENELEATKKTYFPGLVRVLQPVAIAGALLCGILIGSYTAKKDNTQANQVVNPSENIEFLRTNLFISDFADEDTMLGLNK